MDRDDSITGGIGLLRWDPTKLVDRGDGIVTRYLLEQDDAFPFISGITTFTVGGGLPFHFHNCEESVIVLTGLVSFEWRFGKEELCAHDATWVRAGIEHRFANIGDSEARILWIYGSPDADRTLSSSGKTVRVGSKEDSHFDSADETVGGDA